MIFDHAKIRGWRLTMDVDSAFDVESIRDSEHFSYNQMSGMPQRIKSARFNHLQADGIGAYPSGIAHLDVPDA